MRRRVVIGIVALGLTLGVIWGGARPEPPKPGDPAQGRIVWGDRAQSGVVWSGKAGVVWGG